jgi:ubiquinone/menaquinone biosynthesis C-methylase UbiE
MTHYLNKNYNLNESSLISVLDDLPLWSAPFGLKLLETIHYKKNIKVLDIGFGLGFPLLEIAMRLGKTCKLYGIDPWKSAIERTQLKINHYDITNVELIEGFAENIPLNDNTIDLLVSNNGTNNVQDLSKTLTECYRVARPGAQFVMTVNLPNTMFEFYTIFEKVLINNGLSDLLPTIKSHILSKRLPLEALINKIELAGFKVLKAEESQFSYKFNDAETMFSHFLISLAFLGSWKEIVPKNMQVKIFKEIENLMNTEAELNGVFLLSIPYVTIDCVKQ